MSAIFALTGQLAVRRDPALSDAAASGDFDIVTALSDTFQLADKDTQTFTLPAGAPRSYDVDLAVIGEPNVLFIRAGGGIGVAINGATATPDVTCMLLYVETGINTLTVSSDGSADIGVRIIMGTLAVDATTFRAFHA